MSTLPLLPLADLTIWMTPVWIISLGVTAAAVVLAMFYGIVTLASPRGTRAIHQALGDGLLTPLGYVTGAFVLVALLAAPTMPVSDIWWSLRRLPTIGPKVETWQVEAQAEDYEVPIDFYADELQSYEFRSDRDVRIATEPGRAFVSPDLSIDGGEPYAWNPNEKFARGFQDRVTRLYLTNTTDEPATVTFAYTTDVEMPVVHHLPIVFVSVLGVVAVYLLGSWLLPGIATVAVGTAKEAMSQPLFVVLLVAGGLALVAYIYIPYHTFGEDVKILTDSGLTTIMVLGIVFALWTASTSVSDEIEGKTALTVLSKPVSRRQFVLGKFFGILWPLLVMFVILGAILLVVVSYKVVYDARETSNPNPNWELCYAAMISVVPGLVLGFLEATTLAALSVAISTRLSMLPNLIICGAIYVIGNLLPQIVLSSAGLIPFVAFTGKLLAVVMPVLDHFNIQPAIAAGQPVPPSYLGFALLYCVLYSTAAMLLALILFEDRDLA